MDVKSVKTAKGAVRLPAYLPVTTYGPEYPTDRLIRPFLGRFADMLMVSYYYGRRMTSSEPMPVFVDSGGFAALLAGAQILEREDGLGIIRRETEEGLDEVTPEAVLALQMERADWASTLDFPVPPAIAQDEAERERRLRLTLANARWAQAQPRREDLRLFGSVQGWGVESYVGCARELLAMGFTDLALGGFVPRAADRDLLLAVTRAVHALLPAGSLLHVFGIGEPSLVRALYEAGATSTDSSSFVRAAASGKRWDSAAEVECPSPLERAHVAVANYRYGAQQAGAARL